MLLYPMRLSPSFLRWSVALLAMLTRASVANSQDAITLSDYLKDHPWNAARSGPLLVLEPERVTINGPADALARFKRVVVTVGRLSAIVPTEMVLIDDTFRQPPNMYDGLPREAKVLYLLSTLTQSQWQAASGSGIGLNDLHGEQRAVFQSLIPRPFRWAGYLYGEPTTPATVTERGSLTDSQAAQVRLRVIREAAFDVYLADKEPGAYSTFEPFMVPGAPGTTSMKWDDSHEADRPDAYGVIVRQTVPNVLKPSDLPYRSDALNVMVTVPATATVKEVLSGIGGATGLEIHADLRVADRSVVLFGQRARAADLLQALALAVTGTYRRVGPAYVLTSDHIGMGTCKLRFGIWKKELDASVWKREDEWRRAIGKAGGPDYIHFAASDPLGPSPSLLKKIDEEDWASRRNKVPANELTPAMRAFLQRATSGNDTQHYILTAVGVHSQYVFGFVLPDGRPLEPYRSWLGAPSQFVRDGSQSVREPQFSPANLPAKVAQEGPKHALILKAADADGARAAVRSAASHGFRELWLQTADTAALQAALADGRSAGISVYLVIRPWDAPDGKPAADPDVTILGETGAELAARMQKSPSWQQYFEIARQTWRRTPGLTRDLIAPSDAGLERRWREFVSLAGTPGLAGACLLDTAPPGYEGLRTTGFSSLDGSMIETRCFGYSVVQRLAFLRLKSIDPIDIAWFSVYTDPDLRQPFFLDEALRAARPSHYERDRPHPAMATILKEWDAFRGDANRTAVTALLESVAAAPGNPPILVEAREDRMSSAPEECPRELVPWQKDNPLPAIDGEHPWLEIAVEGCVDHILLRTDLGPWEKATVPVVAGRTWRMLPNRKQGPEIRLAFDATNVSSDKLEALLDSLFARRK